MKTAFKFLIILFMGFNFILISNVLAEDSADNTLQMQFERGLGSDVPAAQSSISCESNKNAYPWCNVKGIGGSGGLVNQFYNYALAAVGVAALGAIIYGGILYTMSAGNPSGQQEAISWITGAVYGLILLLGANLLLRTINPQLVKLELESLEKVKIEMQQTTPSTPTPPSTFNELMGVKNITTPVNDTLGGGYRPGSGFRGAR